MQGFHRHGAAGVLILHIALAVVWSFVIPLGGGIDEPRHLRYLEIVATERRLPTPAEKQEAISHHPPLHYLLAAPLYLAARGLGRDSLWHALRLGQVVLGAATVFLTFAMLRRLLPERPWAAVAGMAAVGLLPHFLLVCAVLSNDVTAALLCGLVLYLVVRAIVGSGSRPLLAAGAGLAAGGAVLTKMTGVLIVPVALAALVIAPLAKRRPVTDADDASPDGAGSEAARHGIAFASTFMISGGVWLAYYLGTWGRLDSDPPWPETAWPVHTFGARLWRAIDGLYRSTWVQVGWLPGPHSSPPLEPSTLWPRPDLETAIMALTVPLALIGLVGSIVLAIRWLRSQEHRGRGVAMAMLLLASSLTYAALAHNAVVTNPGRFEGGRYAMVTVAALAAALVTGPLLLSDGWRRAAWVSLTMVLLIMHAVSFWEFYAYLIPTFAP